MLRAALYRARGSDKRASLRASGYPRDRQSHNRWLGGAGTSFSPKVKLPDERAGTVLIFKSYDRVSYGLIVGAADVIRVKDVVHNP